MDAAMAIESRGDIKYGDKGNMTKEEIDKTIKILIGAKKSGQFRAFWTTFDESVNLMAAGEVVIQSMWSPAVTAVRARGIPCYYVPLNEGYRAWASCIAPMRHLTGLKLDAAYEYLNWYQSGWQGGFIAKQGYYSSVPETARKFMTEDEWGFWYDGKDAKSDIKDPYGTHASASGRVVALHERPLRLGGAAGARAGRVLRDSAGPGRGRKLLRPRQVRHHSDVRPHQLQRAVELPPDLHAVREDHQVRADRVGHHARDRLYGLLFSRLPRAQHPLADGPVSALHRALLDIQRHPDDLVDPAFGPPWAPQPVVDRARPRRSPAGVSPLLGLLGGDRLRAPVFPVHDRADLQLNGSHRAGGDRGSGGWRREPVPRHHRHRDSAVEDRHRARLHLRHRARHG